MVQSIPKFCFSMVHTIEKLIKMAAILSTIVKSNTIGKQNRPRGSGPDGRINKNRTAENKQPDGRTERSNLTLRPNID